MTKSLLALLGLVACTGTSCKELTKSNHKDFRMRLITNSPVKAGEEVWMKVDSVFDDYTYELRLPDEHTGFSTKFQADKASFTHIGWYKVTARADNNFMAVDSIYLDVLPDSITCTPEVNKLRSNTNVAMDFRNVYGHVNPVDEYEITANSSTGDMYLIFAMQHQPEPGRTYFCSSPADGFKPQDEVEVYFTWGSFGSRFYGNKGEAVHLTEENGKLVVSLCDFKMSSSVYGDIVVNARLVE